MAASDRNRSRTVANRVLRAVVVFSLAPAAIIGTVASLAGVDYPEPAQFATLAAGAAFGIWFGLRG